MVRKRIPASRQTTYRNRRWIYRSLSLGESVVQMLYHMGRIFEDNSKADGTLYGLRIDRKRRRELQRKRLAMGHKPDDHEEISHT